MSTFRCLCADPECSCQRAVIRQGLPCSQCRNGDHRYADFLEPEESQKAELPDHAPPVRIGPRLEPMPAAELLD